MLFLGPPCPRDQAGCREGQADDEVDGDPDGARKGRGGSGARRRARVHRPQNRGRTPGQGEAAPAPATHSSSDKRAAADSSAFGMKPRAPLRAYALVEVGAVAARGEHDGGRAGAIRQPGGHLEAVDPARDVHVEQHELRGSAPVAAVSADSPSAASPTTS